MTTRAEVRHTRFMRGGVALTGAVVGNDAEGGSSASLAEQLFRYFGVAVIAAIVYTGTL